MAEDETPDSDVGKDKKGHKWLVIAAIAGGGTLLVTIMLYLRSSQQQNVAQNTQAMGQYSADQFAGINQQLASLAQSQGDQTNAIVSAMQANQTAEQQAFGQFAQSEQQLYQGILQELQASGTTDTGGTNIQPPGGTTDPGTNPLSTFAELEAALNQSALPEAAAKKSTP